jgi:hypothetical protein
MPLEQMNGFTIIIGSVTALIGLVIISLSIIFLKANRAKNILSGILFILMGGFILWLSLSRASSFHLNIGVSDRLFGFLVICFVLSLFILKGALDIRAGSWKLKAGTNPPIQAFTSQFQIIIGVILAAWGILIFLLALWQFWG